MIADNNRETLFWKKKEYISFILSILVFLIHSYFIQDTGDNSLISIINHKTSFFFSRSITQFAVPMFFILSGISFFKGYDNKKYPTKIKSRLFTLVIPYLLWNTVWLIWEVVTSFSALSESSVLNGLNLVDILKGIFFYGCNPPFWFIFDLIVFSFAAPVVFLIIRNKYIGIASVVFLSISSYFGIHLPASVFYYPTAIVFYILGALIGYHYFDFACMKSSRTMQIGSVIFLGLYILIKTFVPQKFHIYNYTAEAIVFILSSFALWNIADIFIEKIKPRAIYRRSFAVYAMHLNVAGIVLKILSVFVPQSKWLEIPKLMFVIISTLLIINLVCSFLEKFLPKIYSIFMGNRVRKHQ